MVVSLIAITSALPVFFVQPDDAPLRVNVFKYLAKTGAFVGSMLMVWQFLLGFRGAVSAVFPDLTWVVNLHKRLGQFGLPIILLHPIFIGLYYLEVEGTNIYALDLADGFSQWVLVGMVTLGVVAFVYVTSAFWRDTLGFHPWLYTHLSSYLVPPMLFAHSFALGPTIRDTWIRHYWWFFTALMVVFLVGRLAHKLGATTLAHRVTETDEVADSTTEIVMAPEGRWLRSAPGQFIYLRGSLGENAHPYSVSGHDDETGRVSVTVSEAGPQSSRLQGVQPGERLLLDGPYGMFTRPAMATGLDTVMIAGGIGITAFREQWQRIEAHPDRTLFLFYGNETYGDIAYRDELDALQNVEVVHVMNDEEDFDGEQGHVTVEVLERHLANPLGEYQFLLCGPPPMVDSLKDDLADAGVPSEHIRYELFST